MTAGRRFTVLVVGAWLVLWSSTAVVQAGIRTWTTSGPEGGAVWVFAVAPTENATAYAVTGAGFFATSDGGQNWTPVNNGLTTRSIADIAIDAGNAAVVYAATDLGLFKTEDRGRTWRLLPQLPAPVAALAVDPTRPASLYAIGSADLYMSTDGGETWKALLDGGRLPNRIGLAVHPTTGAVHTTIGGVLMSSTDHGATWTAHGLPDATATSLLALDPSSPSTIYVVGNRGLFKSINAGQSWTSVTGNLPYDDEMGMYFLGNVVVDPSSPSRLFIVANGNVCRSTDGGASWTVLEIGASTWVWSVSMSPSASPELYAATSGDGVFKTTDGGGTWAAAGHGLRGAVVSRVVRTDAADPSTIIAATAAGIHETTDGGSSWARHNLSMDVHFVAVDPNDSRTIYAGSSSQLMRTRDGGRTWSLLRDVGLFDYLLTLIIDPADPATLYLGSGVAVSRSRNRGDTWTPVMQGLPTNVVAFSRLAIDRSGVIYAGSVVGMFRSTNAGASWTPIGAGLPQGGGSGSLLLEVDPYDGSLYTSIADQGLFKSVDRGLTWESAGLSNHNVTALVIDSKSSAWYAGTSSAGVFSTADGGQHWAPMNEGLPKVSISSLALEAGGKVIHAGTRGGGVFDYELSSPLAIERMPDDAARLPRLLEAIASSSRPSRKTFLIAAAASTAGANGTFFRSDVTLINRANREQDVVVAWLTSSEEDGPAPMFKIKLPAPVSHGGWFDAPPVTITDFVRALSLSGLGSLLFIAVGPSGDFAADGASIDGFSRIWTFAADGRGTVSQSFSGVDPMMLDHEPHAMAVGLRQEANFRTNVGVVNLDTKARTFDCRILGQASSTPLSVRVAALSMKQLSIPQGAYGPLAIEVWAEHSEESVDALHYPWMLYGSTVDNVTGDGWTSTASAIDKH